MKTRVLAPLGALAIACSVQAQCSISFPQDTITLYWGYEPMSCATLEPGVIGAEPPQFLWSDGSTGSTVQVCDTASSWYEVVMTDDTLCSATDSVFVNVMDVRCGNNMNKVLVCHVPPGNPANAHTICISASGVPAHLEHGCHLGACAIEVDSIGSSDEVEFMVSPNPMNSNSTVVVRSVISQRVLVRVVDAVGRVYLTLLNADMAMGEERTLSLSAADLPANPSFLLLEARGATDRIARPVLIGR